MTKWNHETSQLHDSLMIRIHLQLLSVPFSWQISYWHFPQRLPVTQEPKKNVNIKKKTRFQINNKQRILSGIYTLISDGAMQSRKVLGLFHFILHFLLHLLDLLLNHSGKLQGESLVISWQLPFGSSAVVVLYYLCLDGLQLVLKDSIHLSSHDVA